MLRFILFIVPLSNSAHFRGPCLPACFVPITKSHLDQFTAKALDESFNAKSLDGFIIIAQWVWMTAILPRLWNMQFIMMSKFV